MFALRRTPCREAFANKSRAGNRDRDKLTSIVHKMHPPLAIKICVARMQAI